MFFTLLKKGYTRNAYLRKPICDIVFCFLLSYFEFLVLCSVFDVVHFERRNSRGRDKI